MRIAIWHNLPSGGGKRALHSHVKGLLERGHEVETWALSSADLDYLPLSELAPEHVVPFPHEPAASRGLLARAVGTYRDAYARRRAMLAACKECARQIHAGGFDLLLAHGCRFYLMPFVGRYVRLPRAVYLQEPNRYLYEARPALPWIGIVRRKSEPLGEFLRRSVTQDLLLPLIRQSARDEWLNARAYSSLLVNSYYSREVVLRAYGRDATVCYLGVDTEHFGPLNLVREPLVLGVGSLTVTKGVDSAIRALAWLEGARPRLVWIANSGNDMYAEKMRHLAASLGVDFSIEAGVSDERLAEWLNRASLMLYTSRLEPFGLSPLEANACGTPVVAVAEGGVRETIRHGVNGLLVGREPSLIARAVGTLLADPGLAQSMGEQAVRYVREEWSLERSIDRLEKHLRQTASMAGGRKQ